ncbi:hypothetical protein [Streptococcus suis]|uniref:hypothetical protein n=1 Tax=Streptococcus suis TaxID=1307 RepID=UPI0004086F6D|nr:hypothetical protein [Streptococcus suis]MCG9914670.1 hypothetical protein [Streptococcus suis]MCG9914686.1 hypothetical protein [Streptococcus suis]MCG9923756.1 hypothetical protein [Streptococcus suis]MCG9931869.1 hypothetical protein [Streptococcus suis]
MEKPTETLLTVKQLEELGNKLTDIMKAVEMNNLALEAIQVTERVDNAINQWLFMKYIDIAHAQNQRLHDELDRVAFILPNNNDAKELEGTL